MSPRRLALVALGLAAVAARLWLVWDRPLTAIAAAALDDDLYVAQAESLLAGDWLGPYTPRTLVKGPFYSMFVAAAHAAGIRLLVAEQLLYVLAAAVLAGALLPVLRRGGLALAAFAVVLFHPMSYSAELSRVFRSSIYPPLAMLVLAGAIGTALALRRGRPAAAGWSALLGLAGAALSLTREEGVWILPAVVLLLAWSLPGHFRSRRAGGAPALGLAALLLPAVLVGAAHLAVAAKNRAAYGVFTVNELTRGAFPRAVGSLYRVRQDEPVAYVPVPGSVRQKIYEASPAFREVGRHLDDEGFWRAGCSTGLYPESCGDIAAGWFVWALRNAAALEGHHASAAAAASYYRQVDQEIDRACAAGPLDCARDRRGLAPPWRRGDLARLPGVAAAALEGLVRYGSRAPQIRSHWSFSLEPGASAGPEARLAAFARVTGERLAGLDGSDAGAARRSRQRLLAIVARLYAALTQPLALLALGAFLAAAVLPGRRRSAELLVVLAALAAAVVSLVLLLAAVEVAAFPGVTALYLAPAWPPLLLFVVLAPVALSRRLRGQGAEARDAGRRRGGSVRA